ncbi:MAG: retroviral-like aspartic protease family protein [Spirochaetaceae bacterium]|nr:retroviral-like aspartic protease family protein [Spirochaetaceae bacterium]
MMGLVYTEITLKNVGDVIEVNRGYRAEKEVRTVTVQALVDTGSGTLVITEAVRDRLGLAIKGMRNSTLANSARQLCQVTEPVEIHWKDRETACPALVVPGAGEVLLGAIPLEDMDLMVDPDGQRNGREGLVGVHGDEPLTMLK